MTTITPNVLRDHRDTGNVGSFTTPVRVGLGVGQRLIVLVNAPVTAAVTSWAVTDSKGNTYAIRATQNPSPVNQQMMVAEAVLTAALTTSDTVTIAATGANPAKWQVIAVAVDDATGFDKSAVNNGSGTGMTVTTTAGATNDQLFIGFWAYTDNTGVVTFVPTDTSTALADETASQSSSARSMGVQYKVVSGSGTRTTGATLSDSNGWAAIGLLYNIPAVGAPSYDLTINYPANKSATADRTYVVDATASTGTPSLVQTSGTAATIVESPAKVYSFADPGGTDDLVFELSAGSGNRTIVIPRGSATKPASISFYGGTVGNIANWG